jgi:xanthine dehydrogenase accessory factor
MKEESSLDVQKSVYREVEEALQRGEAVALVTILKTQGSTPQKAGAKMVVSRDGRLRGTVGGGCVEAEILWRARQALENLKCEILSYDYNADEEENGLICGGSVTVFIEPVVPAPRVFMVGAGHVAMPLSRIAKIAGFQVIVLDDRVKYANRERFPEADTVEAGPIPELAQKFTERDGVPREKLEQVHSPMGLDLGGNSPGEIAVSIVAEMIAVRHQRSGKPMMHTERQEHYGKV